MGTDWNRMGNNRANAVSKLLSIFCRNCGNEFMSNGPEYCSPSCAKLATGDAGQTKQESKIIIPSIYMK